MFNRIWKEDWCSGLLLWTTTLIPPYYWGCQCSSSCFQEWTGKLQLALFLFTYFTSLSSCSSTISWIQCKAKLVPKEIFLPSFPSHYASLLVPCDHTGTWWAVLGNRSVWKLTQQNQKQSVLSQTSSQIWSTARLRDHQRQHWGGGRD